MATNAQNKDAAALNLQHHIAADYGRIAKHKTCNILVIGSGYGGSIVASRLARAGQKVCLLERGNELRPGEYPTDLAGIHEHTQVRTDNPDHAVIGRPTALFDLRINEDMSALIGCGLGGTSLINANVALKLDEAIFERDGLVWPTVFRDQPDLLEPYYKLARAALGSNPYPLPDDPKALGYKPLNKLLALEKSALTIGVEVQRPDINVTFDGTRPNHFGFQQAQCNLCGDCCSGCNEGAKNTTLMNYLPDAKAHGAEIFCNTTVDRVEQNTKGWSVHVRATQLPEKKDRAYVNKVITADIVVLACGSLGSTEIMLRSKAQGLTCSDQLGKQFSGNGDLLAFGYNSYWQDNDKFTDRLLREDTKARFESIYGIGKGSNQLSDAQLPGPCITGVIDLRDSSLPDEHQLIVEEGVIPGALATVMSASMVFGAAGNANFLRYGVDQAETRLRDIETVATTMQHNPSGLTDCAYTGAISRTQTYLVMSMDDSQGELKLDRDRLKIHWPGVGKSSAVNGHHETLARINDAVQGQLITNPLLNDAFGNKLITVHPLGGCVMGDTIDQGVVNDRGQVFNGLTDESVYSGLYICDGSIIPGAVGVNPLLTISALVERCSALMASDHGWTIDYLSRVPERAVETPDLGDDEDDEELDVSFAEELESEMLGEACDNTDPATAAAEKALLQGLGSAATSFIDLKSDILRASCQFSEEMRGFAHGINNGLPEGALRQHDYERAFASGRSAGSQLKLNLVVSIPDVVQLHDDRETACKITGGRVQYGRDQYDIRKGTFRLLPPDGHASERWLMVYELECGQKRREGFTLVGRKYLHGKPGSHWWTDLTTLYVDLLRHKNGRNERFASGIVSLTLQDFVHQLSTFETELPAKALRTALGDMLYLAIGATGKVDAMKTGVGLYQVAKLGASLAETVFRAYGGLLATLNNFPQQDATRLPGRAMPAGREYTGIESHAGFTIKLTRYRATQNAGSTRYPIILAPGMGVTASSFATTSVDCNLVEFLTAKGHDVWLFDYRASADSGSSTKSFTIDDIAEHDWPAAIDFVLAKSRFAQVHIVAHCVGSMSLLMGLLKRFVDKSKIRSLVSSQLTLHPVSNWLNNAKADLDVINQLESIPLIKQLGSVVTMRAGKTGFDRMFDVMAFQVPKPEGEECTNPTCHRILSVYGPSYLHSQLNRATHIRLADWFGPIHLDAFRQITHIIRAGHVVDAEGKNTYLQDIPVVTSSSSNTIDELDLPITFMAGALNLEFLPQTSARTFHWLCAHNPLSQDKYHRHVFSDYGHMDCFIGKNASRDIFPQLYTWIEKYQ
jgi:cholesterol oxidase